MSYSERNLELHRKSGGRRASQLPEIWEAFNHPLHPTTNPGRTYFINLMPTLAAMQMLQRFEQTLGIPKGKYKELVAQGLLEMKGGDYMFARNKLGTGKPEDDVVLIWMVGSHLLMEEDRVQLEQASDRALGPKDERTSTQIYMEKHAQPVRPGTRCYNIATQVEQVSGIVAPNAQVKCDGSVDRKEFCSLAKDMSSSISHVAMENMRHAPKGVGMRIRKHNEFLGLPHMGFQGNWAYQTIQCNVAAVPSDGSGSLGEQMGAAGTAHFDEHDEPTHYSNMLVCSQLPPGYDPGYFFWVAIGAFTQLDHLLGANFSGNWKHGGSGPFPPVGEVPPPWAYRFTLISYPPAGMTGTSNRVRLAASPSGPIYLAPEMQVDNYTPHGQLEQTKASFSHDAHTYMDRRSYSYFLIQKFYQYTRYMIKQTPDDVALNIDPQKFFEAFSFLDEDGKKCQVDEWVAAPPVRQDSPHEKLIQALRDEESEEWDNAFVKTAGLVPSRYMLDAELRERMATLAIECGHGQQKLPMPAGIAGGGVNHVPGDNVSDSRSSSGFELEVDSDSSSYVPPSCKRKQPCSNNQHTGNPKSTNDVLPGARKIAGSSRVTRASSKRIGGGMVNDDESSSEDEHDIEREKVLEGKGKGKADNGDGDGDGRAKGKGGKGKGAGKGTQTKVTSSAPGAVSAFPFLDMCNIAQLEMELLLLKREKDHQLQVSIAAPVYTESERNANLARQRLESNPADSDSAAIMASILENTEALQTVISQQSLAARLSRGTLATGKTFIWRYVEVHLPKAVRSILSQPINDRQGQSGWLPRLVESITWFHLHGVRSKTFGSHQYGFHVSPAQNINAELHSGLLKYLAGKELKDATCRSISEIVATWLQCPRDSAQKLAWFVSAIVSCLGEEALTMSFTWNLVAQFKPSYVIQGPHPSRPQTASAADHFTETLRAHNICREGTPEYLLYTQYKGLLNGSLGSDKLEIPGRRTARWTQFVNMWKTSLAYILNPSGPSTNAFHSLLLKDDDFYLPIREKASTRIRSQNTGQPYDSNIITTEGGIFSALVLRGITYRSGFSKDRRLLFGSSLDLHSEVSQVIAHNHKRKMEASDQYFCLKTAYGQPAAQRGMEHATTYWENIVERNWPAFVNSNPTPTFKDTLQFFRPTGNPKLNLQAKLFPQLGNLGGFALACDLTYAGVCQRPTLGELAESIAVLNLGGVGGLRDLGLISELPTAKLSKIKVISRALTEVCNLMDDEFTPAELEEMGFDLISLEHSLCKFHRALRHRAL